MPDSSAATPDYRQIIAKGSQSFARAARLLPPPVRTDVLRLYAWCRACDDLIDGQDAGHGRQPLTATERRLRLVRLQEKLDAALGGHPIVDPHTLDMAALVRKHEIPDRLPWDLLLGFGYDVDGMTYATVNDTLRYCYHVAGAVGLMMARIMGAKDADTLDRACDLGLAFQLTNIARDLVEDARAGHLYAPLTLIAQHGLTLATIATQPQSPAVLALSQDLVRMAEPYYESAYHGALRLPFRSRWAILAARLIYRDIGMRILAADTSLPARAGTGRWRKTGRVLQSFMQAGGAVIYRPQAPPRVGLWQRA